MISGRNSAWLVAAGGAAAAMLAACSGPRADQETRVAPPTATAVELTPEQRRAVTIGVVGTHDFAPEVNAYGTLDWDEDKAVQVFPNYQGKILEAKARLGDRVTRGEVLYTIESPDLIQAESNLIAAAGVYDNLTAELARVTKLRATKGVSEKDYDQAVSDQMTAAGNLAAARSAVRVFGKSDAQIDHMVASRRIDPALSVASPVSGLVTARSAQPGLLAQPGSSPAPFTVADVSTLWMNATPPETEAPLFRPGQKVEVAVDAFPGRTFDSVVSVVGPSSDPGTHTVLVRAEVRDPAHELKPGMFARFIIHTGAVVTGLAVPQSAIVREGDGTMTLWVTRDDRHFQRRTVTLGAQQNGYDQVVSGLQNGEQVVTSGAIYLSNMQNAAESGD
ncbi:MAG: efflux RND transporter periplasmic adaptor subunit [Caulobacteraceae bacterium]|nr:efflux RND transporter periplasmic adaptor subunit [Caulobacteraceae bacterium]